ncbi:GNAT family N-acetyltransferase [Falsirhodobacter halotolerans]|uniref:GNAT family N-acetyltransferase n=1 Tax=Falsirhodobacter halotolerans TaxID=1146892 RepID=UPI001FD00644|nr:GNAT family N-acetyltransferase [Falsirhodobacter halotolerans]MCJ8138675.1 GNAT family N-acetyltransferase [Falsirhodobacter halotolerans]
MWDDLARIHAASFTAPAPWSANALRGAALSPGGFLLRDGAGFLIGRSIAGEAELLTLATAPDARGRGIGGRLVAAFLARAATDADTAFLEVAADNAPAIRLYLRHGFVPVGTRPRYYGAIDARMMRRNLTVGG